MQRVLERDVHNVGGRSTAAIQSTHLSDVIRRNTTIDTEIPDNVFVVATP